MRFQPWLDEPAALSITDTLRAAIKAVRDAEYRPVTYFHPPRPQSPRPPAVHDHRKPLLHANVMAAVAAECTPPPLYPHGYRVPEPEWTRAGDAVARPFRFAPSPPPRTPWPHFTLRKDGRVLDHTPWLFGHSHVPPASHRILAGAFS